MVIFFALLSLCSVLYLPGQGLGNGSPSVNFLNEWMGRKVFPRPPYLTVVALPTYELEPAHKVQWLHTEEHYAAKSMGYCVVKSTVHAPVYCHGSVKDPSLLSIRSTRCIWFLFNNSWRRMGRINVFLKDFTVSSVECGAVLYNQTHNISAAICINIHSMKNKYSLYEEYRP